MAGTELFGQEEKKEVMDVLETGILFRYNHDNLRNGHWKAKTFEKEFAAFHKINHCYFCSSGTAADILSLAVCGIGLGDEVIVSPFSFIAPVEAVMSLGAVPVFAEIDETMCLSPEGIEKAITPRTKAVLLVHVFGSMANVSEIKKVCDKHQIILIEDAAPALGATHYGKLAGTYGKVACYSFDFFKVITAGEGGAVITNDDDVYEKLHMFADHGHDHIGDNRGMEQHPILGLNFRNSEIHAAIALAQFRKLGYIIDKQRKHYKILKDALSHFDKITFRVIHDESGDTGGYLAFYGPDAETTVEIRKELAKEGIATAYWYQNNFHYLKNWNHLKNLNTIFKTYVQQAPQRQDYNSLVLPVTENIMQRLLTIEIKVNWSESQLNIMSQSIELALNRVFNS